MRPPDASQTDRTPQPSTAWLAVQVSLFAWCVIWLGSPALLNAHGPGRVDSVAYMRLTLLANNVLASLT